MWRQHAGRLYQSLMGLVVCSCIIYSVLPQAHWYVLVNVLRQSLGWTLLGVLSSIGFGTGLHTGLLFLYPHIVVLALGHKGQSPLEDWRFWLRVLGPGLMWGLGTALGELPPYLLARAARRSSMTSGSGSTAQQSLLWRVMTDCMQRSISRFGFWGIFALACWPNAAFDCCGMLCGYMGVTLWTFLSATIVGKMLVKSTVQCVGLVWVFHPTLGQSVLPRLEPQRRRLWTALHRTLYSNEADSADSSSNTASWLSMAWTSIVLFAVLLFVLKLVEQVAQGHHRTRLQLAQSKQSE